MGMPSESRSEKSNKKDYLLIMARLLPYIMPKATEVESVEAENGRKLWSWFGDSA